MISCMAEYPITLRVTQHTLLLITQSVVALGNQEVVCCVCESNDNVLVDQVVLFQLSRLYG